MNDPLDYQAVIQCDRPPLTAEERERFLFELRQLYRGVPLTETRLVSFSSGDTTDEPTVVQG